jgi:hypothetical protein
VLKVDVKEDIPVKDLPDTIECWLIYLFGRPGELVYSNAVISYKELFGIKVYTEMVALQPNDTLIIWRLRGKRSYRRDLLIYR